MDSTKRTDHTNGDDLQQRLAKAQKFVRAHVPRNVSLADELIAERREEARREIDDHTE